MEKNKFSPCETTCRHQKECIKEFGDEYMVVHETHLCRLDIIDGFIECMKKSEEIRKQHE